MSATQQDLEDLKHRYLGRYVRTERPWNEETDGPTEMAGMLANKATWGGEGIASEFRIEDGQVWLTVDWGMAWPITADTTIESWTLHCRVPTITYYDAYEDIKQLSADTYVQHRFILCIEEPSPKVFHVGGDPYIAPWLRAACSCHWRSPDDHRHTLEEHCLDRWRGHIKQLKQLVNLGRPVGAPMPYPEVGEWG